MMDLYLPDNKRDTIVQFAPDFLPWPWATALRALRDAGLHSATIAGGALRDLDHERDHNDVDIFTFKEDWETWDALKKTLDEAFGRCGSVTIDPNWLEYTDAFADVAAVYEYVGPGLDTYQIIVLDRPMSIRDMLFRMDMGLSQIAHDGVNRHETVFYYADKRAEQFTVTRCENEAQWERTYKRWRRLRERYPHHPLVTPEPFKQFQTVEGNDLA